MYAVGVVHMLRFKPSVGRKTRRCVAEKLRTGFERASNLPEGHGWSLGRLLAHDLAGNKFERLRR